VLGDGLYADEPLADEEWIKKYQEEVVETNKLEHELRERLEGSIQVDSCYLRSIAYREFSRLVYGFLGNKRIPLPACAYTAIRKQFLVGTDETYTGFELDEDD
ncbi:unnamed protein product, partial [Porites evermanni]